MKYTIVTALLAALVAADTINQLVEQIPICAVTCIGDAAQSVGCDVENFSCTCGKVDEIRTPVVECLSSSGCSPDDQKNVLMLSEQICNQATANATVTEAAVATTPTPSSAAGGGAQAPHAAWAGGALAAAFAAVAL